MPIANTITPDITYFSMIYVMSFKKSVFIRREKKNKQNQALMYTFQKIWFS